MSRIAGFFLPRKITERLTAKGQGMAKSPVTASQPSNMGQEPPTAKDPSSNTPPKTQEAENVERLLASANDASGPARNAWLAFLGLTTYLFVTLAGVTDEDLLHNSPVTLPIIDVKIPLFSFFLAAPFLFLLVHLGLLVQHAMLAHKYHHFSAAIAKAEKGPAYDHPDRRLVHSYVFSQMLAGTKPPWLLHMLMRLMVFVTLSLLPVLVLLYFQVKFLPSHDVAITHAHRIALLGDLALLLVVRPFAAMPYLRPHGKKLRFDNENWSWELSYWSIANAVLMCMAVISFSLLVVTVPNGCFWSFATGREESETCFSLDRMSAGWWATKPDNNEPSRGIFAPTRWLFGPDAPRERESESSFFEGRWFHRNLQLSGRDLVRRAPSIDTISRYILEGKTEEEAIDDLAKGFSLRGRDLRYADLSSVRFYKADLSDALLQGAYLLGADLQGANLSRAQLQGANLAGGTQLQGATLSSAQLENASLFAADLRGADLSFAHLMGAEFSNADLRGADLSVAQLQGALLSGAQLQGADLHGAQLQGADLRGADLRGAYLLNANLQGADLSGSAQLQGANLTRAKIWQTVPPEEPDLAIAEPMDRDDIVPFDIAGLDIRLDQLPWLKKRNERIKSLLDDNSVRNWSDTDDYQFWLRFAELPEPHPTALSEFLSELACIDDTGGYLIKSIARRLTKHPVITSKDRILTAKLLIDKTRTCVAAEHLDETTLARLKDLATLEERKETLTQEE